MPNWCENTLTVYGDPDDIDKFIEAVAGKDEQGVESPLDFMKIDPTPQELKDTVAGFPVPPGEEDRIARYGFKDWYDWQIAHWGVKWEVSATRDRVNENTVVYLFDSAWAPPIGVLVTASEQWPTLIFHAAYDEPGMDFGGYTVLKAGDVLAEDQGESVYNLRSSREFDDWKVTEWLSAANDAQPTP